MLHNDRLTLAILLCRISLKGSPIGNILDSEFQFFLRGKEGVLSSNNSSGQQGSLSSLNQEQIEAMIRLSHRIPSFKHLSERVEEMPEFGPWLAQNTPEQCVPKLWDEQTPFTPVATAMYQLLAIQVYTIILQYYKIMFINNFFFFSFIGIQTRSGHSISKSIC